jgi:flagellar export protein FliJ
MSWTRSLIRVREFEIEVLRKRLASVLEAREAAEAALRALDAEAQSENQLARSHMEAGWSLAAFREALKQRRARVAADMTGLELEEQGCRDALAEAFTDLKKVESVADLHASKAARAEARREQTAMDEIALRTRRV